MLVSSDDTSDVMHLRLAVRASTDGPGS